MSCLRYASRLYTIAVRIVCTTSVASSGLPGGNPRSDVRLLCPFVYINESDALTVASCSVKIQKKERHHLDASPPELNDKNKKKVTNQLAEILGVSYEDMKEHVYKQTSIERVHPEGRRLSYDIAEQIAALNLDGVYLVSYDNTKIDTTITYTSNPEFSNDVAGTYLITYTATYNGVLYSGIRNIIVNKEILSPPEFTYTGEYEDRAE